MEEVRFIRELPGPTTGEITGLAFVSRETSFDTTPAQFDAILADPRAAGYRLNFTNYQYPPILYSVITMGNIPLIRHIIALGKQADLDVVNFTGAHPSFIKSPLIQAIEHKEEALRYPISLALIKEGAYVNSISLFTTPLIFAANRGEDRLVRLFLEHGAFLSHDLKDYLHAPCSSCEGCEGVELEEHQTLARTELVKGRRELSLIGRMSISRVEGGGVCSLQFLAAKTLLDAFGRQQVKEMPLPLEIRSWF